MRPATKRICITISAIMFSGICLYLSNGLHGDLWFLFWIAPVPVLILSFNSTGKQSFVEIYGEAGSGLKLLLPWKSGASITNHKGRTRITSD